MHIPTCQTQQLHILTFAQALVPTRDDFDRETWLYVPDHYADYRYLLGTRGQNPLICIGINPSTAAPGDLDNTLKSVERIAAATISSYEPTSARSLVMTLSLIWWSFSYVTKSSAARCRPGGRRSSRRTARR